MTALEEARKVADAVLYEGYLLYPYRASAAKNQVRWQFGVLVPSAWAGTGCGEPTGSQAQCLLEPGADATLHVVLRFLQVQSRGVQRLAANGEYEPVASLSVGGEELLSYDEAEPREIDKALPVALLREGEQLVTVRLPAWEQAEPALDAAGEVVGRVVRRRQPLEADLRIQLTPLPGPYGAAQLTARLANVSGWSDTGSGRDAALHHSLVSAHMLFGISDGKFLSMIDPPEWARKAIEECRNEHCWPVLIGENQQDVMLASPIILYDYPTIAPESPGDLFDATEIDEILLLRTMTLTDEEKREARATDPRAAAIVDRADNLPPDVMDRLHGAVRYMRSVTGGGHGQPGPDEPPTFREPSAADAEAEDPFGEGPKKPEVPWWDPGADASVSPETDTIRIGAVDIGRGSRIRLMPGHRRSDAQDLFLIGRSATVQAVFHDVDGDQHIAVTLDDDPLADLMDASGRYLYFAPDEIEPWEVPLAEDLTAAEGAPPAEGAP